MAKSGKNGDKQNLISRKMMTDVCRENLTPIQMEWKLTFTDILKMVQDQSSTLAALSERLKLFEVQLGQLRMQTTYSEQNRDKAVEGYQREL
jgi:hypothetical protein